ncbi:efflux RND transporter permease subunit [bacterium]|nr:efflux RND transporter permease subunit [bacterium]
MTLAELSIKRPIFITCVVFLMLAAGASAIFRLGVDLFPNVQFPVVTIQVSYRGASPAEMETLVSKPLEDEISSLSGIKRISSTNQESLSTVVAEFTYETDVKYAEQQIRDRVGAAKKRLPTEIDEPVIRRVDPADQPILILSVQADVPTGQLYDLANEVIKPRIEQVNQVGLVEIIGGRKREIQVNLDREKLKVREISATQVANRIAAAGQNIPVGKVDEEKTEVVYRTLGEFNTLDEVKSTIVNFFGNDVPVTVSDLGTVTDGLVDERSRSYVNGKPALTLNVFRQSGSNTIAVVNAVLKKVKVIEKELANYPGKPKVSLIRDGSLWIHANVEDVQESIIIGIVLAVVVVFFFLGSGRSTIITGLALPNSLIGAFVLMSMAGFTINIMTLLALSLSVGLLIDDAIVVRENIFRHLEMGSSPMKAAKEGTLEVTLAVIATTLTVIAVFGPVGFLKGVTGQFFREFGLTICFAMAISLFDALTIAPMLSAYFAGSVHTKSSNRLYNATLGKWLASFERGQVWLEGKYEKLIAYSVKHPMKVLVGSAVVFFLCCATLVLVPKTFLPPQDAGEFSVGLDMPPGTNLETMTEVANKVDEVIRANSEVALTSVSVGGRDGAANVAETYVKLVPAKTRKLNTGQFKDKLREQLKDYAYAIPKVKDYDAIGAGQRPFMMNVIGNDQKQLEDVAEKVFQFAKNHPGLKDVDTNFKKGKPEFQVVPDQRKMEQLGMSTSLLGMELRAQVEGIAPAKFRQNGIEYDIRVRLQQDQRNLKEGFRETVVPNINNRFVRLPNVSKPVETLGPAKVNRQDRARAIQIAGDITPGKGLGDIMKDISNYIDNEIKLPQGMRYVFIGQAENFQELGGSMLAAMGFGILFIYLVLASLYESFVTPFTIMLALPLAICGSFVSLAIARESLNLFSMIGTIMLLGIATKNSILLVDYANQQIQKGVSRTEALMMAGKTRLRPILMTTMALIAGTLPIALGLNEASRQRTSMGVCIIGGLISSTLLTLVVVPAAFSYIDRFRVWSSGMASRAVRPKGQSGGRAATVVAAAEK